VDDNEKGPYILHSEVEKAIKGLRTKKVTDDCDILGDVLKLFGEDDLKIMTQLIKNIHEIGE
jgi:energy-converting hydrogenase A subunit M